ncbi:nucleotidyltransferase domain-containing protein [Anaerolineae bacterium CFX7]|nr:nucleotidyltransferase domain-containing protein [Anaerolineae bacterium CFX7]
MSAPRVAPKNKKRVPTKRRVNARQTRERRATYRAPRWKIPDITPIGSNEPVSKTLPRAVKRVVETLHPEKIILFGSYAYGNPTPDSDVDLLVVMKTDATSANRSWAVSRLMTPRPFAVDIVVRTPGEIKSALRNGDFFIQEITERGRILFRKTK